MRAILLARATATGMSSLRLRSPRSQGEGERSVTAEAELSRPKIMDALRQADIGYRIITGGCITRHDVIKHYDYECVDGLPNANLVHDHGFFVGNHPSDLTPQIARLREVLDRAAR